MEGKMILRRPSVLSQLVLHFLFTGQLLHEGHVIFVAHVLLGLARQAGFGQGNCERLLRAFHWLSTAALEFAAFEFAHDKGNLSLLLFRGHDNSFSFSLRAEKLDGGCFNVHARPHLIPMKHEGGHDAFGQKGNIATVVAFNLHNFLFPIIPYWPHAI